MNRGFSFPSRQEVGSRLGPQQSATGGGLIRIFMGLAVAAFALISFLSSKQYNPVTNQNQYISITKEQEIALGIQSAPEMEAQYGGLEPDQRYQQAVEIIGRKLVTQSFAAQADYPFEFHVLADPQTINAFALPGGQVFITRALMDQLSSEGQVASVLGHEIVHVVARHSAEQIAQADLAQGLTGALVMATYNPNDPKTTTTADVALLISQLVQMKFSRNDESVADTMGVKVMAEANYDPRQMLEVMKILEKESGSNGIEFFSTHPSPENRIDGIQKAISDLYPNGVPSGMVE